MGGFIIVISFKLLGLRSDSLRAGGKEILKIRRLLYLGKVPFQPALPSNLFRAAKFRH